jgi:3-oxoacyl-[acyl-carrier protein] reductase
MTSKTRKAALITGAGRNIGRAVAIALAQDGFDVAVNGSSDRAAAESVAAEAGALGVKALVIMGDVGSRGECTRIASEALAAFGTIDVLVNNAALRPEKPFLEITPEDWARVMTVDLEAAVWLSQALLPGMIGQSWGRIVNFTGMNAMQGYTGRAPVSVAKHGAWGLTKALAKEFAAQGITVNAISPGPIAADDDVPGVKTDRHGYVVKVPSGRMGTPAEIAAVVRMLVGEGGAYVNGQMLQVNGGAAT